MVYALRLGRSTERCGGSSPLSPTYLRSYAERYSGDKHPKQNLNLLA
jgi:hypothetical protein